MLFRGDHYHRTRGDLEAKGGQLEHGVTEPRGGRPGLPVDLEEVLGRIPVSSASSLIAAAANESKQRRSKGLSKEASTDSKGQSAGSKRVVSIDAWRKRT